MLLMSRVRHFLAYVTLEASEFYKRHPFFWTHELLSVAPKSWKFGKCLESVCLQLFWKEEWRAVEFNGRMFGDDGIQNLVVFDFFAKNIVQCSRRFLFLQINFQPEHVFVWHKFFPKTNWMLFWNCSFFCPIFTEKKWVGGPLIFTKHL